MIFQSRNIWSMNEAEMVEAGRKMAALEHSKMCHQATVQIHYVGHDTLPIQRICLHILFLYFLFVFLSEPGITLNFLN